MFELSQDGECAWCLYALDTSHGDCFCSKECEQEYGQSINQRIVDYAKEHTNDNE